MSPHLQPLVPCGGPSASLRQKLLELWLSRLPEAATKWGLLLFSDQIELYLPPRKGRRHILRLIREMLFFKPKRTGTNIPAGLAFLNHVLHRRSIVFLLTDFLHSFGASATQSGIGRDALQEVGLTNVRHDLVCIHLMIRAKAFCLPPACSLLKTLKRGELVELDSSRGAVRYKFAATNSERLAELDRALRREASIRCDSAPQKISLRLCSDFSRRDAGRRRG